jgi:hypothetical protein
MRWWLAFRGVVTVAIMLSPLVSSATQLTAVDVALVHEH